MKQIYPDLYQFTSLLEPMKLSIHQYLLLTEEPILIQTGDVTHAETSLSQIKELLNGKLIKYILISHFESDECGGLSKVLQEYPEAIPVCSEVTARQLLGFGLAQKVEIKKPGDVFSGKDFDFKILSYPSEMHMWEGLLFNETKRGIFFSSDLMFQMGENHGNVIESNWEEARKNSGANQLPNIEMQDKLVKEMETISPKFVASGHGPCIKIIL